VTTYRADWVLPVSGPPIRDGHVTIEGGAIVSVGAWKTAGRDAGAPGQVVDLGACVILPGLVNAHTHLELSWMRGRVPPSGALSSWVRQLMALRRQHGADDAPSIGRAIEEARAAGTVAVADLSNTLASFEPLAASPLWGIVFLELIGFRSGEARERYDWGRERMATLPAGGRVRPALAVHAPYSVSEALCQLVASDRARAGVPVSLHLGESAEELEFLAMGTGPWRRLLEDVEAWDPSWQPPGCGPVAYADRLGLVTSRALIVHGVQFTRAELERLAVAGATLVLCPRSNAWTGAGRPPVIEAYAAGVRVAVGTDSLASVPDLNLFAELAALRALAPRVPASVLIASATIEGARALGFDDQLGSIAPGRRAELVAVSVDGGTDDPEEALVSGVQPDRVRWIES
jgi:aminodeoxyfutalosine deaminase